jgi:hypothetical protein
MSTASTATLEPKTELEGNGPRKPSALRVLLMLEIAVGPTIAGLLMDPDVIEIRCNADGKIYADWFDKPSSWTGQTLSSDMATQIVCIVADAVDQIVGPAANRYILDAEFPAQGLRFHGNLPPVVPAPCFNIRKPPPRIITLDEYVAADIMTQAKRRAMVSAVRAQKNILVVGGTKSGKTTLINAIIDELKDSSSATKTPRQLLHSPHLSIQAAPAELSLGLLVTQISPMKREALMPPHRTRPRLVNFQGAVGSEGGHGQALRRPRRSMPAATVAKTRGSLPSGAADIAHIPPPLDQARARRDLRSLSSHAAPCRR